jgi:Skp family chaperone for outer membrane proteins
MKTIRPLFTAVALVLTFNFAYSQTADENAKEFEKQSTMLIQKLYSCQSMAYTVIGEQDYQTRYLYVNLGSKYFNDAYQSFIKMQGLNENMDEKLRENISTLLQMYAKSFESIDALNKPEMALALSFAKHSLKRLNQDLLCKPTE